VPKRGVNQGAKPGAKRGSKRTTQGPPQRNKGRPVQGTPKWWESHIKKTADHLAKGGPLAIIDILRRTRGWSGKKLDWTIIQEAGRHVAAPSYKRFSFGVIKFCKPVRKLLQDKIGMKY